MDPDYHQMKGYGKRHLQCLALFLCVSTSYVSRSCIGVALVGMTDKSNTTNLSGLDKQCFIDKLDKRKVLENKYQSISENFNAISNNETRLLNEDAETIGILESILLIPPYPQCSWSKKTKNLIVSAYFWGYMLLQIPASQLAHRFGVRVLLTTALTISAVLSFCVPWGVYYCGWIYIVISRGIEGLCQASIFPGFHTLLGKWTPLHERARLSGFALGGIIFGSVVGLTTAGVLAASPLGWPGIFRFNGLLAGIVAVAFWFLVADTPEQHTSITVAERKYIEEGIGQKSMSGIDLPVPWLRILKTAGVYAIIVSHIGHAWTHLFLYTEIPAYMNKVMNINVKANGFLSALPFIVMWFTSFFINWLTDMLIVKKIFSVANARKFANSLGFIPAGIGLVCLALVPKNIYVAETLLILICAFKVSSHVGFQVNHIDLSPNFAGTLMSISNFIAQLFAAASPFVTGAILAKDDTDEYLWRNVFFLTAGIYFFTNLVYVIFGAGEIAEWNTPKQKDVEDENGEEKEPMINERNGKKDG